MSGGMSIDIWMCEGGLGLLTPFRAEGSSRDVGKLKTNLFGQCLEWVISSEPVRGCVRSILLDVRLWKWLRALRFRGRRVEGQRQ